MWPQDEQGHLPLKKVLDAGGREAAVYCCGPAALLDAVTNTFSGRTAGSLHIERFAPQAGARPQLGAAFQIELAKSGITLDVPGDRTIIEVLADAGIAVLSSCREGMCGTCEVSVLGGEVAHRDRILSAEEQAANETMMVCVSRALGKKLTLDL